LGEVRRTRGNSHGDQTGGENPNIKERTMKTKTSVQAGEGLVFDIAG
jgi:hypothetical protein